jgi:hypothetical protein
LTDISLFLVELCLIFEWLLPIFEGMVELIGLSLGSALAETAPQPIIKTI